MKNLMNKMIFFFENIILRKKSHYITLDLGTVNTLVYVSGQGIIYNQPSVMAFDTKSKELIALGNDAYNMIGKINDGVEIIYPLADGVITDLTAAEQLIKAIFQKTQLSKSLRNSTIVLACPPGATKLDQETLQRAGYSTGAKKIIIESETKMAAFGLNINMNMGNLIVDIGGGTTDVAIITFKKIIIARSVKVAGNFFDEEIKKYLRSEHNMIVGVKSITELKHKISSLDGDYEPKETVVYGNDVVNRMPKKIIISFEEIRNILTNSFEKITELIASVLESAPAELSGDIIKNGIIICGGGALIKGIDTYFQKKFNIPVKVANEPLKCVIEGTKALEKDIFFK